MKINIYRVTFEVASPKGFDYYHTFELEATNPKDAVRSAFGLFAKHVNDGTKIKKVDGVTFIDTLISHAKQINEHKYD